MFLTMNLKAIIYLNQNKKFAFLAFYYYLLTLRRVTPTTVYLEKSSIIIYLLQ